MKKISSFTHCIIVAVIIFFTGIVVADDTEIYLSNTNTTTGTVTPNVMFILDTSGSMSGKDGGSVTRIDRMKDALDTILGTATNINVGLMRFHREEGGPVLFPISPIDSDVADVEGVVDVPPVVQSHVIQGADDAEEYADGTVVLDRGRLDMTRLVASGLTTIEETAPNDWEEKPNGQVIRSTHYHRVGRRLVGFRFSNVSIPTDANIVSAKIKFIVDEADGHTSSDLSSTPVTIYGHNTANASRWPGGSWNVLSNLPATTASVPWQDIPSTLGKGGDTLYTPDLSSIITELVSSANGWNNGNGLGLLLKKDAGPVTGVRRVAAQDTHSSKRPKLVVTYGDANDIQQTIGLRFQTIGVPKGATITSARLEFEAGRADTESTSLTIRGHSHGDSPEFTSASGNISNRAQTSNYVDWVNIPEWEEGQRYQSPDLTDVVQEIVNHTDWCGNNALSLMIDGSGLRVAKSFEGQSDAAPVLHIDYDPDSVSDSACINQVVRKRIAQSSNDAEQKIGNSGFLTGKQLEMAYNGGVEQLSGLRFDLPILKDSTILEAHLEFVARANDSSSVSLKIEGELSGNSAPFNTSANTISSRTRTSHSKVWSPGSWATGNVYQSPDIKDIIQEIVNQGGWSSGNAASLIIGRNGSGTKIRRAKTFDDSPGEAPVLVVKVEGRLATGFKTVRSRLKDLVEDLPASGWTPIVDSLYEAALYFRGDDVFYGTTRGNSSTGNSLSGTSHPQYTRTSHPASYSGGTIVREAGCTETNLNASACKSEHIDNSPTYISPITESCQSNNIILLSDGAPTRNYSKSLAATMIGQSCNSSFTGDRKCGPDLAGFLYNNDQTDAFSDDQIIKTYTIGFNIDNSGKQFLKDIAQAGGGEFFPASSSADLVAKFEEIIIDILSHPTSFAAPSLSINAFNKIYHNNEVYFSLFEPDRHKAWPGNIKKYKLCEGNQGDTCVIGEVLDRDNDQAIGADFYIKETAKSFWGSVSDGPVIKLGGAGEHVPSYNSRNVYTYTGVGAPSGVDISSGSTHKVLTSNTALTKTLLGDASMSNAERTEIIQWIQGKDVKDEDSDTSTADNRWVIQDPLHGGAVPVTYGQAADGSPIIKLFVATNSGSLHMLNSATGVEEWAFIPQAMLGQQKDMMNNTDGDHIYGLDSTPTIYQYDADDDGKIEPTDGDYVRLYIGMRRGGRNIYALDVTPTAEITNNTTPNTIAPELLWRIEGGSGDYTKLGQTWSKPIVANVQYLSASKTVLFMAGGYEESSQDDGLFGPAADHGNAIYMIDAATGGRLWWASSDANADLVLPAMTYPIPSDVAVLDTNGDGFINRLYVGDLGGQVWRIDSTSTGARLAAISSSSLVANQRKFFYSPDVAQIYDTKYSNTPLYDLISIGSGNRDHPLDNDVHDRFYAFRDYHPLSVLDNDDARISNDDLYDATQNLIQDGDEAAQETAQNNLKASKGWYINMQESDGSWVGEKILARSLIIDGKLFFTTYIPGATAGSLCASAVEGGGRLYGVDLLNARARYKGWDGDNNNLRRQDRGYIVGAGIASEPIPIFQKNGVTLLVGSGGGATRVDPEIELPRKKTFWLQEGVDGNGGSGGVGMCPI